MEPNWREELKKALDEAYYLWADADEDARRGADAKTLYEETLALYDKVSEAWTKAICVQVTEERKHETEADQR